MIEDKDKKMIRYRLPLFGQIEVTLHEESKIIYEILDKRGEIERLKQIEHLGVLHKVFDCPVYTRWAYVMSILYLIEQARPFIEISNNIKLNEEIIISSGEELLKCWALLLFTGHLYGTFSTERALLKKLKGDDCDRLFEKLFEDKRLRENLMKIVNNEEIFHAFYVLTAYKTLKIKGEYYKKEKEYYESRKEKKEKKGKFHENELLEILKAFLLEEDYYSGVTKGEKLKRLVEYFKSFRELAFVVLDGYYAQVSLNLNPLYIVKNLDEMTENRHLRTLIDDVQKYFYNTIYHSQEGIVSHLYYSNQCSHLFAEYDDVKQLIEDLCDNKIDNKIQKLMKERRNQYKHFIRVKFRKEEINGSLTEEKGMLDKSGVCDEDIIFGITYNHPTNEYYGDICCKNLKNNLNRCVGLVAEEVKKFKEENTAYLQKFLLESIEENYPNFEKVEIDREEMSVIYEIADALEIKEQEISEFLFKFFPDIILYVYRKLPTQEEREEIDIERLRDILSNIEPLSKLYERREPIACELAERIFELVNEQIKTGEMMLEFLSKPRNNFKAFFTLHYKELGSLCEYIKNKMEETLKNEERETRDLKNELKSLINELMRESIKEENENFYYIVIPGMKWVPMLKDKKSKLTKGEVDGLYIKIPKEANKKVEIIIIEAKKWSNPEKDQIKRIRWIVGKDTNDKYAERIKQGLGKKGKYKDIKRIEEKDSRYIRFPFTI